MCYLYFIIVSFCLNEVTEWWYFLDGTTVTCAPKITYFGQGHICAGERPGEVIGQKRGSAGGDTLQTFTVE